MNKAEKRSSHLRSCSRLLSITLFVLSAIVLAGSFQDAHAQTITQVTPNLIHPDGIVKVTFSAAVKPASVKIGNVEASFVSPPTAPSDTIDVKVPATAPTGQQNMDVVVDNQTITTQITIEKISPTITEITPEIVQPGGTFVLTFSKVLKPTSVKIGNVDATFVSSSTHRLEALLPSNATMGQQTITVTTADGGDPLTSSITVAPLILGLKANKDAPVQFSRVVVSGGEVIVQFADNLPLKIKQSLQATLVDTTPKSDNTSKPLQPCAVGAGQEKLSVTAPEDNYLVVTMPNKRYDLGETTYILRVCSGKTPLQNETRVKLYSDIWMYVRASAVVLLLFILFYALYRIGRRVMERNQTGKPPRRYYFLKMILIEPENQTYSLSRAQFVAWLFVIGWCYLFLYYAHGYIEGDWGFPDFGNSIYAFLISLGTLIAAQATNLSQGVKGAGEEHPSVADLIVHGGVLALDRIQQIFWTLIAIGMFIRITVSTFSTAETLPAIPTELLTLMGLSSAGYLGGKLVRGAGPIIDQVTVAEGSTILSIKGKHLSKDAFVWLDGVQVDRDKVTPKEDDPDEPLKFAKELEVTLDVSLADWTAKDHAITVVNNDAQRADFRIPAGKTVVGTEGAIVDSTNTETTNTTNTDTTDTTDSETTDTTDTETTDTTDAETTDTTDTDTTDTTDSTNNTTG